MSAVSLVTFAVRSKISAVALSIALLLSGCLVAVDDAADALRKVSTLQEPLTTIDPPSGWPLTGVRAFVGRNGSNLWLAYMPGVSGGGTCHWRQIGSGGVLWERTRVRGTVLSDEFRVVGGAQQITVCSVPLTAMPSDAKLELFGLASNDFFVATDSDWSNLQIDGGDGDDFIVYRDAYAVYGRNGRDYLIGDDSFDAQVFGLAGDDFVCSYGAPPFAMWGGDGTDKSWGAIAFNQEMEGTITKGFCDIARAGTLQQYAD